MCAPQEPLPRLGKVCRIGTAAVAWTLAFGAAGCDIPTEPPILETSWSAPIESTQFGVDDLLPASVTLTADTSAFTVSFAPVFFSASLADVCPPCALANGLTVPKPAFADSIGDSVDLPARVASATVEGGSIRVEVTNGLNFDPIRPAAGAFGSLTVVLTDGADGDMLGSGVVSGVATSFAPSSTVTMVIPLQASEVDGSIDAAVLIDSPAGDPVTVDSSLRISVVASVDQLRVTEVAVDVSGEAVSLDPSTFDLGDVGEELFDRVIAGSLRLDVLNPFGVGADFQLTIDGSTFPTIQHQPSIVGAAEESVRIDFSSQEIQGILAAPSVSLSGGGTVDPAAGIVRVRPGQELEVEATLDFELRIGG